MTVRHMRGLVRNALGDAEGEELVHRNAARAVRPPAIGQVERRALTVDEAKRLLDVLHGHRLDGDPQWGFGWVGWASGHTPPSGKGLPTDYRRAEDLLREGYAVGGVRDRDAIAEWLRRAREESEHPGRR